VAYYYLYAYNRSLSDFNIDDDCDMRLKEGTATSQGYTIPSSRDKNQNEYISYKDRAPPPAPTSTGDDSGVSVTTATPLSNAFSLQRAEYFANVTAHLATWIHLDTPGFLPQRRQHRQFGLSVLHIAQQLLEHVEILNSGGQGLAIPDLSSSKRHYPGWIPIAGKEGKFHKFGWRDLFDISVRWRQLSEPMDVVYWLDR
jgi:hypothetical protein